MEFIPAVFKLERNGMLPLLRVTGISKDVYGSKEFLLGKAVSIIEIAQKEYGAQLMDKMLFKNEVDIKEGMIAVTFYLLFKTEEILNQAVQKIRKGLG